jgi:hypothetical protein
MTQRYGLRLAAFAICALFALPSWAQATPGKSPQWIALTGTCGGAPATVLDPPWSGADGIQHAHRQDGRWSALSEHLPAYRRGRPAAGVRLCT